MLNTRKKVIFVSLFLVLFLVGSHIGAKADESIGKIDIDNAIVDGTEYSQVERDEIIRPGFSGGAKPTEEDILDSLNQLPKVPPTGTENKQNEIINRTTWIDLDNISEFNYYSQLKTYTCGPACLRMAIRYLYSWLTESYIAEQCQTDPQTGTTLANMKNFINGYFGYNMYYSVYNADSTTLKNNLYSGVVTYMQPPIVGLEESTNDGWPFNLDAHYIIVYSVRDDKEAVKLADPWAGFSSSFSPYKQYMMSTDAVFAGYDSAGIGYMY